MANLLPAVTLTTAYVGNSQAEPAFPERANDEAASGYTYAPAGVYSAGVEGHWIADFGADVDIVSAEAVMGEGLPNYAVDTSPDGSTWTERADAGDWSLIGTDPDLGGQLYRVTFTTTARYVRYRFGPTGTGYDGGGYVVEYRLFGDYAAGEVVEPSDPPPYEPPEPAGPILEIYTADPDGAKWDTAIWDTDVWAASGWQNVTPEGVTADVSWGTEDAAMGILARPDAGVWQVTTYDPDRRLDPGNDASPFVGYLRPGLPIRISHAGVVLRTGFVTRLAYSYERQTGAIAATDSIALLAGARVPESALAGLAGSLWDRVADVIDAANVPVVIRRGRPGYDLPLSDPPDGERSAWDHVWLASQEVLAIPWVYRDGAIAWQFWSAPLERGTVIGGANLRDLTVIADGRGLYSTIRALTDAPPATEELSATPTPAYGERLYDRAVTTINADSWVAAVLADRAEGGLRFIPGEVVCWTAADVAYFADVRIGELVTLSTPDVTVTGIVLGIRFRVAYDQSGPAAGEPPDWRFQFHIARTDSSVLVADFTGDPIVSDDDLGEFLTGG